MYGRFVERIYRKAFGAVNKGEHAVLVAMCRPDVTHRFDADQALGGTRYTRDALRFWFDRLGRVTPGLDLIIRGILMKGGREDDRHHPLEIDASTA